jgi:hypothetical protein
MADIGPIQPLKIVKLALSSANFYHLGRAIPYFYCSHSTPHKSKNGKVEEITLSNNNFV